MNPCYLEDDGDSQQVIAVEEFPAAGVEDGPQALWVRVGLVFDDGQQRKEPGVWIEYQERYMAGPLAGPVLLTPAVWRQLNRAVERRLVRRMPLWHRVLWLLTH